ncbi:hypothetical protein GZH53_02785 [Flavihumibacter sp. R14]|nr:hypothetical protein [Flavihumibacter soli]
MKYLYGIIFLVSFKVNAQVNTGARFTGMASTGVSISDIWSIQENQAGIASVRKFCIALGFARPFTGYDLRSHSAAFILPVDNNVLGVSLQKYGTTAFEYQRLGLTYAKSFGTQFFAAMTINYHHLAIENYGRTQAYSIETGVQYKKGNNLSLGAHLSNPGFSSFQNDWNSVGPTRFLLGASYNVSRKLLLAMSLDKVINEKADIKTGLEYKIIELLALRGGFSANPFKQYAGFGVNHKALNMDVSISSQPIVGYSPQISLSYELW